MKLDELHDWLKINRIQYNDIDLDVIEIIGMGKAYVQNWKSASSIFRKDKDGEYIFNSMEDPGVLADEGIEYTIFKFGDNWYYFKFSQGFQLNILKYVGKRVASERNMRFVNLGVHTPYELLNGSFMTDQWIKKAVYLGHDALGVCDKNTMASLFRFQKDADSTKITPVFGYSLTFIDKGQKVDAKVYVQTQEGLRNLLRIQKAIMVDNDAHYIDFDELLSRGKGNILVFGKLSAEYLVENPEAITSAEQSFHGVYYQVDLSEYKAERIDIRVLEAAKIYFDKLYDSVAPVLICDCYYLDKADAKNKIILNKIAEGAVHEQSDDQYFKDIDEHYSTFSQLFDDKNWDVEALFEECCANTVEIASGASARFETSRNFMPQYDMTEEEKARYGTPHNMFCQLIEEGLQRLVPEEKRDEYRKQMEYEKYIIESTNNVDYLLVQYDTVNWCRRNGILTGCGRGSAAGSLLLYLLGITLVDPLRFNLIFERFLLPERAGLYPAKTVKVKGRVLSTDFTEVEFENGKKALIDNNSSLLVENTAGEDEEPETLYPDQLIEGDEILFDNRDELFTI